MKPNLQNATIDEVLTSRELFGALPAFADLSSWSNWRVFLRAAYGLPLDAAGEATFCRFTGRSSYHPPPGGFPVVVAIVGRQSGKSRIAGLVGAFEAITAPSVADRTEEFVLVVAQDQRAALRALHRYMVSPFESVPVLQQMVRGQTTDALRLRSGVTVACYPCRPASIRGVRSRAVVLDELAHFRSTENYPMDAEMLRAARPTLATTGGKLVILSSPHAQVGELYRLHREHWAQDNSTILIWQASAPAMNPTLPADYLRRMEQEDPLGYRAEVLGEFMAGVSALFDPEALEAVTERGVRERPPLAEVGHRAFVDCSGGRRDRAAIGIAHGENNRAVLDCIRWWEAPHNPSAVIDEMVELARHYRVAKVRGDRYAAQFVAESFYQRGFAYETSELDKSALYMELLSIVNSGRSLLLDQPELLRELRGLERRSAPSGKDRVDHAPGSRDDVANAAAGVIQMVAKPRVDLTSEMYWTVPSQSASALGIGVGGGAQAWTPTEALEWVAEDDRDPFGFIPW